MKCLCCAAHVVLIAVVVLALANPLGAEEPGAGVLVFTSESTEGAGGMAARLTFSFDNDDADRLALELASPGKEFFNCQTLDMERVTGAPQ